MSKKSNKTIEAVVIKTSKTLGLKVGETRQFKGGWIRNFLIPKGYVAIATDGNRPRLDKMIQKEQGRVSDELKLVEALIATIGGKMISHSVSTHNSGKLYGSVSGSDVANLINDTFKVKIEKRQIQMDGVIRKVGNFKVKIRLPQDLETTVTIAVESGNENVTTGTEVLAAEALA